MVYIMYKILLIIHNVVQYYVYIYKYVCISLYYVVSYVDVNMYIYIYHHPFHMYESLAIGIIIEIWLMNQCGINYSGWKI